MHWDINELNIKYHHLEHMYNKEKKPLLKNILHDDMCTINAMRSLYYPDLNDNEEFYCKINRNIPEEFEGKLSDIVIFFNEFSQLRIQNKRPTNIVIKDYNELLLNFISQYYPKLMNLYKNLVAEKKIELNANRKFSKGFNGLCFYNISLNELFLYARYNKKLFNSLFLPHELGHAYQATTFPSIEDVTDKNKSLFDEVYSTYIELIYIKHLYEIGYADQARYLEKRYWIQYARFSELQLMLYLNINAFLNSCYLDSLFSMGLSNIFYEDYLKTNNHKMIEEFNELFKNSSDDEIIKEYTLKRILYSPNNALKRLI